jgi:hypothetical protein
MNIFLIPYTWIRHLQGAIWCAFFSLIFWWAHITWIAWIGSFWNSSWDGIYFFGGLAGTVSGGSIFIEASLHRWTIRKRITKIIFASAIAFGLYFVLGPLLSWLSSLFVSSKEGIENAANHYLVSLQYTIDSFIACGISTSLAVFFMRADKNKMMFFNHITAGIHAAMFSALFWTAFHSFLERLDFSYHLYWSGFSACIMFGFFFGLGSWSIPNSLYAGWIRVLSRYRFGHRVPIDGGDGLPKERFVGHYPNGLDLFLPVEQGVQELHLSVFLNDSGEYLLRGLGQQKSQVKRSLEWVQLHYDPRLPAPYESNLSSGDRIQIGTDAEIEFIILPREER